MDNSLGKVFEEVGQVVAGMLLENKKDIEGLYLKSEKAVSISATIKIGKDKTTKVKVKCTTGRVDVEKTWIPGQGELEV
jgi:hypothetical protein